MDDLDAVARNIAEQLKHEHAHSEASALKLGFELQDKKLEFDNAQAARVAALLRSQAVPKGACPVCYAHDGVIRNVVAQNSATDDDFLRCGRCQSVFRHRV